MRFIFTIYIYGKDYSIAGESSKNIIRIVSFIIAFVYYGFGFFVTHGYSRIGLLVVCKNYFFKEILIEFI
jgi:hypothetical protein